jgi:hypothetical protein
MQALVGTSAAEIAQELGLRIRSQPTVRPGRRLRAWRAILAEDPEGASVDELARRLRERLPQDFPDDADARQEVLDLLRAADAL